MNELMLALMVWAAPFTGLPVPAEMPRIVMAEACEIERLVYDDGSRPCSKPDDVRPIAFYLPARATMYLPDTWQAGSLRDVSILLHELVHHMQVQNGRTPDTVNCVGQELELPAYNAQIAFLKAAGVDAYETMNINALSLYFFTTCDQGY